MLKKAVQQGRSERRSEATLRYVEPLSDARTMLADFFQHPARPAPPSPILIDQILRMSEPPLYSDDMLPSHAY
jgi:hypothetical protein